MLPLKNSVYLKKICIFLKKEKKTQHFLEKEKAMAVVVVFLQVFPVINTVLKKSVPPSNESRCQTKV